MQGTEAVWRHMLATRGAMLENAESEAGKFAASWRSAERTSLAMTIVPASLRSRLQISWPRAGQTSLAFCWGVLPQPS